VSGVAFYKYEGLGNDFAVFDLRSGPVPPALTTAAAAIRLCDRRLGIGGDGILPLLPPTTSDAHARMRVLNADGSEAEMCGNGIRCVAKHLYDTDPSLRRDELRIETGAGVLTCHVLPGPNGLAATVAVEMGRPRLLPEEIPVGPLGAGGRIVAQPIDVAGGRFDFTAVSMGNPHAVLFVKNGEDLTEQAQSFGPSLERHPLFPRRTNVEFARVRPGGREIDLVVWERGCGITQACGTGACATAVAAVLEQRAKEGEEIAVHLPGGTLHILVHEKLSGVRMRGPAVRVFDGALDAATLDELGQAAAAH
jgi:diaminopimelate epimerase